MLIIRETLNPFMKTCNLLNKRIYLTKSNTTLTSVSHILKSHRTLVNNTSAVSSSIFGIKKHNRRHKVANKNMTIGQRLSSFLKVQSVTSITTGESYNLSKVISIMNSLGYHPINLVPDEIVTFKYLNNGHMCDIMVVGQNGSVVSWGIDETVLMDNILPLISSARNNPLPPDHYETEDIDCVELKNENDIKNLSELGLDSMEECSFIENDLIVICSFDDQYNLLDKAAFSSGISRSTRLAVLESALESHIYQTRTFTELLSIGKTLNLRENDVLKSTGKLFLMRGRLNLYSELIETPDLYWSEPRLEKIYKQISKNLDIHPRISILNKKLDYATDESRALMALLNERKSTRLEWIIIYLITVEVCFELYHFYEKYWKDNNK